MSLLYKVITWPIRAMGWLILDGSTWELGQLNDIVTDHLDQKRHPMSTLGRLERKTWKHHQDKVDMWVELLELQIKSGINK